MPTSPVKISLIINDFEDDRSIPLGTIKGQISIEVSETIPEAKFGYVIKSQTWVKGRFIRGREEAILSEKVYVNGRKLEKGRHLTYLFEFKNDQHIYYEGIKGFHKIYIEAYVHHPEFKRLVFGASESKKKKHQRRFGHLLQESVRKDLKYENQKPLKVTHQSFVLDKKVPDSSKIVTILGLIFLLGFLYQTLAFYEEYPFAFYFTLFFTFLLVLALVTGNKQHKKAGTINCTLQPLDDEAFEVSLTHDSGWKNIKSVEMKYQVLETINDNIEDSYSEENYVQYETAPIIFNPSSSKALTPLKFIYPDKMTYPSGRISTLMSIKWHLAVQINFNKGKSIKYKDLLMAME